jgi:hypothetical protein
MPFAASADLFQCHVYANGCTNLVKCVPVTAAWHIDALRVQETTRRFGVAGWFCSWDAVREVIYRR